MNEVMTANDLQPCAAPDVNATDYDIAHATPFWSRLTVDRSHVSQIIEHMNNIELVRLLDRAAQRHSDALGYTRPWLLENGIMWFVARHEIDYLAESWPGDVLFIATWVRNFSRVKSWRDYVIIRPADGTVVCRASTLWVLVDLESRRPTRITTEMAEKFAPLEDASQQFNKSTSQH